MDSLFPELKGYILNFLRSYDLIACLFVSKEINTLTKNLCATTERGGFRDYICKTQIPALFGWAVTTFPKYAGQVATEVSMRAVDIGIYADMVDFLDVETKMYVLSKHIYNLHPRVKRLLQFHVYDIRPINPAVVETSVMKSNRIKKEQWFRKSLYIEIGKSQWVDVLREEDMAFIEWVTKHPITCKGKHQPFLNDAIKSGSVLVVKVAIADKWPSRPCERCDVIKYGSQQIYALIGKIHASYCTNCIDTIVGADMKTLRWLLAERVWGHYSAPIVRKFIEQGRVNILVELGIMAAIKEDIELMKNRPGFRFWYDKEIIELAAKI